MTGCVKGICLWEGPFCHAGLIISTGAVLIDPDIHYGIVCISPLACDGKGSFKQMCVELSSNAFPPRASGTLKCKERHVVVVGGGGGEIAMKNGLHLSLE